MTLTARAKPIKTLPAERAETQARAVAKWLRYCMNNGVAPRRVLISEKETAAIVGFPVGAHTSGDYAIPSPDFCGRRLLRDVLHAVQAVRPAVWSRAVEFADGRRWREFEMRLIAKRRRR